jgi:hypothetical protein
MSVDLYLQEFGIDKYQSISKGCHITCLNIIKEHPPPVPTVQNAIPVKTGLFEINNPKRNSPVIVTGNYLYTQALLAEILASSGINCYLLSINTEGYSVDNAVATGKFTEESLLEVINEAELKKRIGHRYLILPGLVDLRIGDWIIIRGPICALELPLFLYFQNKFRGIFKV